MQGKILAVILTLFVICFIAIVIEELFLGGRRLRRAKKAFKELEKAERNGA